MAKTRQGLSAERIRQLARTSAERLLKELRAEVAAIERTFPELAGSRRQRTVKRVRKAAKAAGKQARRMSAAARKEASKRMKKYWAERKRARRRLR